VGFAHYSGQTDHSGIAIVAESVEGSRSLGVSQALAEKGPVSRAIAAQALTDATGEYELKDLPEGSY
jgi:hypothetical protein